MEGQIAHYRRGKRTYRGNQMIIMVKSVESKEKAEALMHRKVTWASPAGKKILGKVTHTHGNSGAVRVQFEKGMPGQSIGQKVQFE